MTEILRKIEGETRKEDLWQLYNNAFAEVNRESPCRQSYTEEEFKQALEDEEIVKFLTLYKKRIVGIALVTNDLGKVPWISTAYYELHHPAEYRQRKIFYIKCLAIEPEYRGLQYVRALLEEVIGFIRQRNGIGAFDFSEKANRLLPQLVERISQGKNGGGVVDRQSYYVLFSK